MKIISIASIKGGVGKTSLTAFLAQVMASEGKRVLVIDSDSNNNLTDYYLRERTFEEIDQANLYHLMNSQLSSADVIYKTDFSLDIIPCTLNLSRISHDMAGKPTGMIKFSKIVNSLDYDIVLIDTPPFLGYELRNALHCADMVLTPINLTRWTLQAMFLLQDEIKDLEQTFNESPKLLAVPSIVTDKENESLRTMGFDFSESYIKKIASIKNAVDTAKPLKKDSPAWELFSNLYKELM